MEWDLVSPECKRVKIKAMLDVSVKTVTQMGDLSEEYLNANEVRKEMGGDGIGEIGKYFSVTTV